LRKGDRGWCNVVEVTNGIGGQAMAKGLHTKAFPGETSRYRTARNSLLREEMKLRRLIGEVAEKRRALPPGGAVKTDYVFDASAPDASEFKKVRFSELFEPGKRSLFVYNFMYPERVGSTTPCPSCTSIIDAIDGQARHVTQRINFVIVAKTPIAKFREHARRRGWSHTTLLSSAGNTFNRDYNAEDETGQQLPLAHVFTKRGQKIHHFWSSELFFVKPEPGQDPRHVDFLWPLWAMFDRTPEGRGRNWGPSLDYS
jgi:predicted dithiol-disulfide oxidoreductase (DUF899 family)